ncbi:hypothetical protein NFI96_031197, partial [Prochilodus magdalenae]
LEESFIATLLIISIIQFIISICVSSFACGATCSPGPYVNITVVANPEGGSMVSPFPVHHKGELAVKMSGTAVPLSNTANGYTIVSQVLSPSSETGQVISSVNPVQKFLKGWPKTLGTVQIMIGLLAVILGIVLTVATEYLPGFSIFVLVMASVVSSSPLAFLLLLQVLSFVSVCNVLVKPLTVFVTDSTEIHREEVQ